MNQVPNSESGTPQPLSSERASSLISMCADDRKRPVDDLIERLERSDGAEWLIAAFQGSFGESKSPIDFASSSQSSLEDLVNFKNQSKRILKEAKDSDSRLAGLAGYFLSIAAAWRLHNTSIGGRSADEIVPVFLDLATVVPEPLATLLGEAALTVRDDACRRLDP